MNAFAANRCSNLFRESGSKLLAEKAFDELAPRMPGELHFGVSHRAISQINPETHQAIGLIKYKHFEFWDGRSVLEIELIRINDEVKRIGMSRYLLAALIKKLPPITEIRTSTLLADNRTVFENAIESGLPPDDALKQTPAYRLRRSLGFGAIDFARTKVYDIDQLNLFVVEGPENTRAKKH